MVVWVFESSHGRGYSYAIVAIFVRVFLFSLLRVAGCLFLQSSGFELIGGHQTEGSVYPLI
jgi:hypothetical protein